MIFFFRKNNREVGRDDDVGIDTLSIIVHDLWIIQMMCECVRSVLGDVKLLSLSFF